MTADRLELVVDNIVRRWGWPQDPFVFAERLVVALRLQVEVKERSSREIGEDQQ